MRTGFEVEVGGDGEVDVVFDQEPPQKNEEEEVEEEGVHCWKFSWKRFFRGNGKRVTGPKSNGGAAGGLAFYLQTF